MKKLTKSRQPDEETLINHLPETITTEPKEDISSYNIGESDYAKYQIQPWGIWLEYGLNPWDADIVKRILRNKATEPRRLDYEKIIHVAKERIRQLDAGLK